MGRTSQARGFFCSISVMQYGIGCHTGKIAGKSPPSIVCASRTREFWRCMSSKWMSQGSAVVVLDDTSVSLANYASK
jgi:hypothetical protein